MPCESVLLDFALPPSDVNALLIEIGDACMVDPGLSLVPHGAVNLKALTLMIPPDHANSSSATVSASFLLKQ